MTFQDIDFHIELFKAFLEPIGSQNEILSRIRKKSGYSKNAFILKLEQAYSNLNEAWKLELSKKRSFIHPENLKGFGFPISGLNRYPQLIDFSQAFHGHLTEDNLNQISSLVSSLKIKYIMKDLNNMVFEKSEAEEKPNNQVKSKSKTIPTKVLKTLEELFREKFGTDKEYQDLKERLFSKELLSDDLSTWIGTKENGKTQLASVIKYAGQNNLQRNLSEKEVIFISVKDFNNKVSEGTVKKGKYENAEYYFI